MPSALGLVHACWKVVNVGKKSKLHIGDVFYNSAIPLEDFMANKVDRLTLFPPSGKRIIMLIKSHKVTADTFVLAYTDVDGISYETTLPFAVEFIEEGHKKAPFND
jgi:hypothetical protein